MVNEDIITALVNAVNQGESLESAIQVMINSGYNPREVQEAAHFVGGGVIRMMQPQPGEQLTMPIDSRIPLTQIKPMQSGPSSLQQQQPLQLQNKNNSAVQFQQQYPFYSPQALPQNASTNDANKLSMQKPKKSYGMEILLLIILLILIGCLVGVIIFKEQILQFLAG